jgi:hypothetical protein
MQRYPPGITLSGACQAEHAICKAILGTPAERKAADHILLIRRKTMSDDKFTYKEGDLQTVP